MRYIASFDSRAPVPAIGYGIRDTVTGQWVVENLPGTAAHWQAAVLSLRYDDQGERPDGNAWFREPPVHVELRITPRRTELALLHMWARETDGLHGYVSYLERDSGYYGVWATAAKLRKLTADEIAACGYAAPLAAGSCQTG